MLSIFRNRIRPTLQLILPHKNIPIQMLRIRRFNPSQMQSELQIPKQTLQHMADALFASQRQPIHIRPPDQASLCSQRHSLGNIRATPNPRIKQNIDLPTYSIHNPRKHTERADPTIDLPASVIADDNALETEFHGFLGVRDALDAFEDDRAIPVFLQELEVFPAMAETWEDSFRPFGRGLVEISFDFDAVGLFELRAELGVGETD